MPVLPDKALADAIVADLNALSPPIAFVAERTWIPDFDQIEELDDLTVAVQPAANPSAVIFERSSVLETWPVDIAFARRLKDTKDRAEIDQLIETVDTVRLHITPDDGEPRAYTAGGMTFRNRGWEFLARFDPRQLGRDNNGADVNYTGNFLSIIRFPFLRTA